jgi:hypothetical protein
MMLMIEDVRLRTTNWVELVPLAGVEDMNAIARQFFLPKGKNNTIQFQRGKGAELYLEIEYSKYLDIVRHIDELENPKVNRFIVFMSCIANAFLAFPAQVSANDDRSSAA